LPLLLLLPLATGGGVQPTNTTNTSIITSRILQSFPPT
jgi:hypothetical protein